VVTRRQVASIPAKAPRPRQGGNASVLRMMTTMTTSTTIDHGREPLKARVKFEKCGRPEASVWFWWLGPEQK
jgi:hypothetical protein